MITATIMQEDGEGPGCGGGERSRIEHGLCAIISRIEEAGSAKTVTSAMIDGFRILGADRYVLTGIPLPTHDIEDQIIAVDWPDCRNGLPYRLRPDDLAVQKAIDWPFSFVLRARFHTESGLARAAGLHEGARELLVVPVVGIARYQGLVALTFTREAGREQYISEHSMRFAIRSQVVSMVHAGFFRLAELGQLDVKRKGQLTPREREIVALSALGKSASEIAGMIRISKLTVVAHLRNAALKLAAANKAECVLQAIRYHQIGPGAGRGFYEMNHEIFGSGPYDFREIF